MEGKERRKKKKCRGIVRERRMRNAGLRKRNKRRGEKGERNKEGKKEGREGKKG